MAFTRTETIEVSTKINDEIFATQKEIPVPANYEELVEHCGAGGAFDLAYREFMRQAKYELGQKLKDAVAPQDEEKPLRKANAKYITV